MEDDKLALMILSLMHYWSMADGQRDMQKVIIKLKMVGPFNLEDGMSLGVIRPMS